MERSRAARIGVLAYGALCYLMFVGVFAYAIGFLNNLFVPKSMDVGPATPFGFALAINAGLLGLFAVQHSVMARPGFKRWWTRFVPEPIERSTYVLFSNLAMIVLFWQWRPMGGVIWHLEGEMARGIVLGLYGLGIAIVFVSTCLIHHFDLFGMRQVWLYFRGRRYAPVAFRTPGPYRIVRHPLYVGWLVTFWAAPTMTVAHLVFALATTGYILVAIRFEERDLVNEHGDSYVSYRKDVPMLVPKIRSGGKLEGALS